MTALERACNVLIGINLIALAGTAIVLADVAERSSVVRISAALLSATVGLLFIFRGPLRKGANLTTLALTVPSVVGGGVAFHFAPATNEWPLLAAALFAAGTGIAVVSFLYLGRSFAIFPAIRTCVVRGPYRFIRHPAYFGEYLLVWACFLANPRLVMVWLPVVVLPCIVVRILVEERLLAERFEYVQYTRRVRWRLLPGIW